VILKLGMVKLLIAGVFVLAFASTVATNVEPKTTRTHSISKTLHIDPPKNGESRYQYVPFQVLPNTRRLTIRYEYDRSNGSNALDIGLFDSRSTELFGDLTGFRGWSGGRRAEFFVSRDAATPGYVPGDLPAGTWRIILGLYRVVPSGVDVTFRINEEIDETKPTTLAAATEPRKVSMRLPLSHDSRLALQKLSVRKPAKNFSRWMSGDLHLHTIHSDGDWTIPELVNAARNAGLDFICITDHNTLSHHSEIDRLNSTGNGLIILRGEEITTYGGHANVWGLPSHSLIDFRVQPGDRQAMSRIVSQAHRQTALISINHPFALCPGCDWSYGRDANGFDAIEVWNGSWDNTDERAVEMWDALLQQGRRISAVASSDSHRPSNPIGQPATHVAIDGVPSMAAVLKSIRSGHTYLTGEANVPLISFEDHGMHEREVKGIGEIIRMTDTHHLRFRLVISNLSQAATVSLISDGKVVRKLNAETDGKPQFVEVDADHSTYFRLEVRDQKGTMLALTNPIYVETKRSR
jgi:hypothetical protein